MQISSQIPNRAPRASEPAPAPKKTMAEKIVDSTILSANYLGSSLSGGVGGLGAYTSTVLQAAAGDAASMVGNLWKAETIGPNLKVLGTLAAVPVVAVGAAVALPVCAVAGLVHGARAVDGSRPRELTIGAGAVQGFQKTRHSFQEFAANNVRELGEFGSRKLKEGEKPFDIPLLKTAKTLAMGAAAAAVGGVAGAICAVVGTARQVAAGLGRAVRDGNLNLPGKVIAGTGAILGGAVQGVAYGAGSAVSILGRGLSETWEQDSILQGGRAVLNHAVQSVKVAASPERTLLQEVQG